MSETDRIIGRLENGFANINLRLEKIENAMERLDSDYHHRKGMSHSIVIFFSFIGGALTHLTAKIFNI